MFLVRKNSFLFIKVVLFFICSVLFLKPSCFAVVDMKNANYSESWIDIVVEGTGYDLRVVRAYNSRSLVNGLFGFGWCSEFESQVRVTAEGGLQLTECGSGLEVDFYPKNFNATSIDKTIHKIIEEVRKRNKDITLKYLSQLKKDLGYDHSLRQEFVKQLNLEGKVKQGMIYYAKNRVDDIISIKGKNYVRTLPDGSFQVFSRPSGKLIALHDKNQNFIKISYQGKNLNKKISHLVDNNGRRLSFFYRRKKISEIRGPNNTVVRYSHKGEDLVKVKGLGRIDHYKYDNLHNLTHIVSLIQLKSGQRKMEKVVKKILYNKDKDWVIGFVDPRGCRETYTYKSDPKDRLNHYSSYVVKKCKNKIVNKSSYEFFHKKNNRQGRYLQRAIANKDGFIIDTTYHPVFGKPLVQILGKNKIINGYYNNGLLKSRKSSYYDSEFYYKNKCKKVSSVKIKYYISKIERDVAQSKRIPNFVIRQKGKNKIQIVKTDLFYKSPKCNLVLAKNSHGQRVEISHDYKGRVSFLKDQSERSVYIKYDENFEKKPKLIQTPLVGSIIIKYKKNGSVQTVESKEGVKVASQVMNVFSHLMDVITPVASQVVL